MNIKECDKNLIYIIRCIFNNKEIDKEFIQKIDMENLYNISKYHNIDALIGKYLSNYITLPKYWMEKINKVIYINLLYDKESKELYRFLEDNNIWYIPLKREELNSYYPYELIRQSNDLDIYYNKKYQSIMKNYFKKNKYKIYQYNKLGQDVYIKKPYLNIEMHYSLYTDEYDKKLDKYYKNIDNKTIKDYIRYRFSGEDMFIYIVSHIYKHYKYSGTGLRSLIDIYVYQKNNPNMNYKYIYEEFEKMDVMSFYKDINSLVNKLFANNLKLNNMENNMLNTILESGTFGVSSIAYKNRLMNIGNNKSKYLLKRLIPPIEWYKEGSPFCYKHRWVIPFYLIIRLFKGLLYKRKEIKEEYSVIKNTK